MLGAVKLAFDTVANDIPGFPVFMAIIFPGLCAWVIIWVKENKEKHKKAQPPEQDYKISGRESGGQV